MVKRTDVSLRRFFFSFFIPIVSTALSHPVSEYLPVLVAHPLPAGCRGQALLPRACTEGCTCSSKAGFVALKVMAVGGCRVKQWRVLRKLAECPRAFSCRHAPLECQARWNTQPRAWAGQGRNFQGFPHLSVEAAHTQNGDLLSAKGLYPTLGPATGLDCAQPPRSPRVNFEGCSCRH